MTLRVTIGGLFVGIALGCSSAAAVEAVLLIGRPRGLIHQRLIPSHVAVH